MRREYIGLNLEKKQFVKIHIIDDHGSHKTPNFLKVMVIEGWWIIHLFENGIW